MGVKKHVRSKQSLKEKEIDLSEQQDDVESEEVGEGYQRVQDDSDEGRTVASRLREKEKKQRKRERFVVTRMWLSTFMSRFFSDRGIGNNILVTNNLVITKNNLTAIIQVQEMSEVTPVAWTSELIKYVKDQTSGVVLDITMKGTRYYPDINPNAVPQDFCTLWTLFVLGFLFTNAMCTSWYVQEMVQRSKRAFRRRSCISVLLELNIDGFRVILMSMYVT